MLPGQAQIVTVFRNEFDSEEMICEWGYDDATWNGSPTSVDAHDLYDLFAADIVVPIMTNQYHFIRLEQQEAVEGGVIVAEWSEDTQGGVNVDAVPQNTAYLIHKFTDGVGAGKKGRCYLPGVREDNVSSGGLLEGSWPDTVSDAFTIWLGHLTDDTLFRMVVNRGLRVDPTDPPPRQPTVEPDPLFWSVTSLSVDIQVASQRRRLRR